MYAAQRGAIARYKQGASILKKITIVGLAVFMSAAACASSESDMDTLVRNAARFGNPVEGFANGQPSVAVPVSGNGPCKNVGVIQSGGRGKYSGGPRIANFSVCHDEVEAISEVSPALPDDSQFKQVVVMTVRGAARYGGQPSDWDAYHVESRRLSPPDARGCAQVETVVSSEGLLVSHNVGMVCP